MDNGISGIVVTYAAGERLTTRGDDVDEIYIILKGKIKCMTTYGTYYLGPGSAAGLTDCYYGMYVFNYFADEDTLVKRYTVSSSTDITRVMNDQADNISIFAIMQSRHISDIIKTYLELTMKCRDVDAEYRPDSRISRWELDKFNALSSISNKTAVEFYKASLPVTIGSIYDGARFLSNLNDACSQMAGRLEINVDYVEPEPEDDFIMAIEDTPAALTDTGDDFDEAIVRYMRKKHNLLIGERTAEDLKIKIGSCYKRAEVDYMDVRGRNLVTGLPKTVKVSSEETEEALRETTAQIVETIHSVLEKTPPELAADIADRGIVLTGGGSLLQGLEELIESKTGITTMTAEDPMTAVAIGTGKFIEFLGGARD